MIVVGIPYYESDPGKREILNRCVSSLKGQDQVIVLAGRQPTLARAINMLYAMGFGMGADHMIICNDDIILDQGDLTMLCSDGVVSPYVNRSKMKDFHAHMWGISKEAYATVGDYFEGYDLFYYDDSDYWMQILSKGVSLTTNPDINISHPEPGRTLATFSNNHERMQHNREIFISRWGSDNLSRIE